MFALHQSGVFGSAAADAFAELGREALFGGFASHFVRAIFAGRCDALFAVFHGDATIGEYLAHFLAPSALGNVPGGVALVTLLDYAQVAADEAGT